MTNMTAMPQAPRFHRFRMPRWLRLLDPAALALACAIHALKVSIFAFAMTFRVLCFYANCILGPIAFITGILTLGMIHLQKRRDARNTS